jgi:D-sedoheptulose 7-phosphate isomerase
MPSSRADATVQAWDNPASIQQRRSQDRVVELAERVHQIFNASMEATVQAQAMLAEPIAAAATAIVASLLEGGKILSCGNGGSAGDAQRLSAKMIGRFERERPGLPAIALTTDSATLTAVANDYSYQDIFAKQVNAIGHPGDVLLAITTSGNSENVLRAMLAARERQMRIIALTGGDGGALAQHLGEGDIEIRAPCQATTRTQELHVLVIHCLCDLIDQQLLGG